MDAEPVDIPGDLPRVQPRQTLIWIRLDGQWQAAFVRDWFRRDGWCAWVQVPMAGVAWTRMGAFRYSEETIRERHGDTPPG